MGLVVWLKLNAVSLTIQILTMLNKSKTIEAHDIEKKKKSKNLNFG